MCRALARVSSRVDERRRHVNETHTLLYKVIVKSVTV